MRLAYFTNTYPRATDTFIRHEVIGLRKRGFDVLTYSVRKAGDENDVDDEVISEKRQTKYILPFNFFRIIYLTILFALRKPRLFVITSRLALKTSRPGAKGHVLQFAYFLEALTLAKHLIDDGIEHLHNHLGDNSGTVTLLAAQIAEVPYSISIHGPHIFFDGLHWALGEKTKHAKFISCIGHFCKSQMMLYSNKDDWSKFNIIRCGVDLDQFTYRTPEERVRKLVYVGRLAAEKGVPILFESLSILKEKRYDIELELIGDGEDRPFLEELAKEIGIEDMITFAGFVGRTGVAEALKASDVFVLPSFAEGIPVSLMEAMAMGVPVIATYVGGVTELVTHRKTGQIVSASDPIALADAIAFYIDNPDTCKEISRNARSFVEVEFNIDDQVDKLSKLFSQDSLIKVS